MTDPRSRAELEQLRESLEAAAGRPVPARDVLQVAIMSEMFAQAASLLARDREG